MITASLVSGFLGAGKSTWLAGQLAGRDRNTRFIVNDVGDVMPDADLVDGPQVIQMLGGCVCCDRAADLVDALRRLCEERHAGAHIDSVVIEASGLSDPNNVADLIRTDPVLSRNIVLAEIVVVIDGLLGIRELVHEPLARRQLDAADRIVVTKTDLCAASAAADTVATVKAIAPTARVQVTPNPHGLTPASIPARTNPMVDHNAAALQPASTTTLRLPPDVDWVVLASWLSALLNAHGDAVLRLKGNVPTANGTLALSVVQGVMHPPRPSIVTTDGTNLVFVSRGIDAAALSSGWARFQATAGSYIPTPQDREVLI